MITPKIKYSLIGIVTLIFASICWYAYFSQVATVPEQDLPLIKAQENIREKPADPGGMEVLNKDKAIYKHMFNDKSIDSKVKIVDSKEKPLSRENIESVIDAQLKTGRRAKPQTVTTNTPTPPPLKTVEANKVQDTAKTEEPKTPPTKSIEVKTYSIRVARLKDPSVFSDVTKVFKDKYPLLSALTPKAVSNNGNYYLDFIAANKEAAENTCKALINQGQKCKIV